MGLVPAMLATGSGSDVQRPLATVAIGGLVTATVATVATVLTLILLPSLYCLVQAFVAWFQPHQEHVA
ncbi:cation efflux system protein [Xanthomonas fragariae]|nr:cation efflux system protein [Xanthomonas fragariae]